MGRTNRRALVINRYGHVADVDDLSRAPRPCSRCRREFQPTRRRRLLCENCFRYASRESVYWPLMSTTIKRLQFGSSAWVPRGDDGGPPRAVMIVVVTCAGFDTGTLIPDLAQYLSDSLSWGELYKTIVPLDSVPIEAVDPAVLAERIGAVLVALDVNQPAPIYGDDSYIAEPDEAVVRVSIEQMVSANDFDRDMLLERRYDLIRELSLISGTIG